MGDLLIYVPNGCRRDVEGLASLGLDVYADDGVTLHTTDAVGDTPDDQIGTLFYWNPIGRRNLVASIPQVDRASQTWVRCCAEGAHEAGRAWIGWPTAAPPGPADLARRRQQPGRPLAMAGAEWLVPIATQLPQAFGVDDQGMIVGLVAEEFRAFHEAAMASIDLFAERIDGSFTADRAALEAFALQALAVNYRIGRDLAAATGVLIDEHVVLITRIAAEFDTVAAAFGHRPRGAS